MITSNVYDDTNGNITSSTVTGAGETMVASTVYGAYPSGIPNKPISITTTKTRGVQSSFVVTQALEYSTKGQLVKKTDFDNLAKKVITVYEYSSLGNLTKMIFGWVK